MQWQIDPKHSSLTFGVRHMMVTTVRGRFTGFQGLIDFDPQQPDRSSVAVTVDAATVDSGEASRDGHLRSADFFDAATYPEIAFRSTKVRGRGGNELEITGDLTIRGITKPVTLEAEIEGVWDDPKMGRRTGFAAKATIDRREWGLVWNQPIANGGLLVGEKVKLELGISAVAVQAGTQAA